VKIHGSNVDTACYSLSALKTYNWPISLKLPNEHKY